jgi:hypothetical protein
MHVLVDCPLLVELRKQLRAKIGDSFNSVTRMPGGWKRNARGKLEQWPIDRMVLSAVLEFARKSERFCSRSSQNGTIETQQ